MPIPVVWLVSYTLCLEARSELYATPPVVPPWYHFRILIKMQINLIRALRNLMMPAP